MLLIDKLFPKGRGQFAIRSLSSGSFPPTNKFSLNRIVLTLYRIRYPSLSKFKFRISRERNSLEESIARKFGRQISRDFSRISFFYPCSTFQYNVVEKTCTPQGQLDSISFRKRFDVIEFRERRQIPPVIQLRGLAYTWDRI